jgi:hypothetical protein
MTKYIITLCVLISTALISPQGLATQVLAPTTFWDNSDYYHHHYMMMRMYMRGYATGRRNLQYIPRRYRAAAERNKERREADKKAREENKKQCLIKASDKKEDFIEEAKNTREVGLVFSGLVAIYGGGLPPFIVGGALGAGFIGYRTNQLETQCNKNYPRDVIKCG